MSAGSCRTPYVLLQPDTREALKMLMVFELLEMDAIAAVVWSLGRPCEYVAAVDSTAQMDMGFNNLYTSENWNLGVSCWLSPCSNGSTDRLHAAKLA